MVLTRIRGSQWTTCPTPREQLRRLRASRGAIVSLLGECQSAGGAEDAIDWDLWAIEARRWCYVVLFGCGYWLHLFYFVVTETLQPRGWMDGHQGWDSTSRCPQ